MQTPIQRAWNWYRLKPEVVFLSGGFLVGYLRNAQLKRHYNKHFY